MKTSASRSLPLLVAGLFVSASFSAVRAEEAVNTIKFSDPLKPGTVKIILARGDIRLRGSDDATVTVKSEGKSATPKPRKDGLRELTAAASFSLTEKDNVITVDSRRNSTDFEITVPRQSNVVVANSWESDITCSGVTGDIEVKSTNGRIRLEDVSGSALVETMNGEITATVAELREGKPLSFNSMNGEISVRLPTDAKATVRLRSRNGAILTDFDEKVFLSKTESLPGGNSSSSRSGSASEIRESVKEGVREGLEVAREVVEAVREAMIEATGKDEMARTLPTHQRPPLPPMTGGKIVTGTLNGGGTDIQIATMNGDVVLRKSAEKK